MEKAWVITDAKSSFSSSDFYIHAEDLGLAGGSFCRKSTLSGGRQSGVEIIELSNGVVTVRVCPTRGMGIIDGSFGKHFLGWSSPVTEIVHPQFINLFDLGGRGAHYGFNELLNRCGIEWSGAMGKDEVVDNMGVKTQAFLPLHGKVGWTPASRVALTAVDGAVTLEGDIPEQNVFGVNYLLRTRLTLRADSPRIETNDTLVNLGSLPGEYEMLYHTNFGPPFLEAGGRYYGTFERAVPRDEAAAAGVAEMDRFPSPTAGYTEQVFLFRARPDEHGAAHQIITNADATLAARVSFDVNTLPYTILWKRCAAPADGYVVGLNPCSDLPNTRRVERAAGRLATVAPNGKVDFHHTIELIEGRSEVDSALHRLHRVGEGGSVGPAGAFDTLSAS